VKLPLTPNRAAAAVVNVLHKTVDGQLADLRPMPRSMIYTGPLRAVYKYKPNAEVAERTDDSPVLLVPPLAAPSLCFDLRRGCSLVEHLISEGRSTYLVDYGNISFADRKLGIEFWVQTVIPEAVRAVSGDAGGKPVHIISWSLGGIMSLLAAADHPDLPIKSLVPIGSPFDVTAVPLVAPLRPLVNLTGGRAVTAIYRTIGTAPQPLVKKAFQFSAFDKYLTKPVAILTNLNDRDFLAQLEAVDHFTNNMIAYPGRTFGQLYHHFLRANDLATGGIDLAGHRIEMSDVKQPVLVIAGRTDGIAPQPAVHHLVDLLTGSQSVRYQVCPGGHLGVLTGRAARTTTWPLIDEWLDEQDG
jgi:polyhydroxyalkanoate synthase subunit PhaC